MAEEQKTGGFTLPPPESAWSNIDWKPLLIGTALSMSPELAPMAPLFMKTFQEGTKNAQAKRFAQGLQSVQKLAAEGNYQAAQQGLQALTAITPPEMLQSFMKFGQSMQEQQQQKQFTGELSKIAPGARGMESLLPFLSPKEQMAAVSPKMFSHEGAVMGINPTTGQPQGTTFLPQAPSAPDTAAFAEQLARQGGVPAQLTNALRSGDPEAQAAALNIIRGTQTAADMQKIQMVGQEATARTAATESTRLGFMDQETEKLADRAEKSGFASVIGKTDAEKFTFLTNPLQEKAAEYIDTETLQPAPPDMTGKDLVTSKRYRPMSVTQQAAIQDKIAAAQAYNQTIGKMREIVDKYPDLFPKAGSTGKNIVKQFELYTKGLMKDVDPKYVEAFSQLEALKAGSARYAKAWGDTGNINEQEQLRQIEGLGLKPGLRENVLKRLDTLEQLMSDPVNTYMKQRGFKWQLEPTGQAGKPLKFKDALKQFNIQPSNPQ